MTIVNAIKRWYFNAGKRIEKWFDDRVWKERMAVALKGVEKPELPFLETVLKNQIEYLRRANDFGISSSHKSFASRAARLKSDNGTFKMSVAVARELYRLTAIVGVQPMQGPVSLAYTMRYALQKMADDNSSGLTATEVADTPKQIRLEIRKDPVEAGTRKLQARWGLEAAQDLASQHGLGIEEEFIAAMADQIAYEVFSEVITDLIALAKRGGNAESLMWSPADIQVLPDTPRHAEINIKLNAMANDIARKTRRGCGNFIITNPIGVSLLQAFASSKFVASPKGQHGSSALMLMGTLNGTTNVYLSMCMPQGTDYLIGYKGGAGEVDAGYIYCPYVPVMPSGPVIDPYTFQPLMTMMTRYGKLTFKADDTAMARSEDYFSTLSFSTPEKVDQPETVV